MTTILALLVLPVGASAKLIERHQSLWEGRYRVLVERRFPNPYYDYAILEPRTEP